MLADPKRLFGEWREKNRLNSLFFSSDFDPLRFSVSGGLMDTIDLHEKSSNPNTDLIKCTASLVAAYVSRSPVGVADLSGLIDQVHTAISVLQGGRLGFELERADRRADRGLDPA
jgi:hypothetical protein